MNGFNIGDMITGNSINSYTITNRNCVCKITRLFGRISPGNEDMEVEVISTSDHEHSNKVGRRYPVASDFFVLVERNIVVRKTEDIIGDWL